MIEEWKQYKKYFISNFGNVKDNNGNLINFSKQNTKIIKVGDTALPRLVYQLFIGKIPKDKYVYRKDGNSENNSVDNLILLDRRFDGVRPKGRAIIFEEFLKIAREELEKRPNLI